MVGKINPVSNVYPIKNHKKKNHDREKKDKPKFTLPPNDAG